MSSSLLYDSMFKRRFYVQMSQILFLSSKKDFVRFRMHVVPEMRRLLFNSGTSNALMLSKWRARSIIAYLRLRYASLVHMPGARNKSQSTCTRIYFAAIHETDASNEDEFATLLSCLKEGNLTEGDKMGRRYQRS
jgi:hypothetical protein